MPDVISKSAFAVRRGVAPSAVANWIARGKLTGAALTADGQINVEEAERQLGETIDPGRGSHAATPRQEAGNDTAAPLAKVRLAREELALAEAQRKAAVEAGELVRADEAKRAWAKELDDLVSAVELFVTELPIKLGLGREAVDIARREWREFRRRRADQAETARAA